MRRPGTCASPRFAAHFCRSRCPPRPPFTASLTVSDPRVDEGPGRGVQPLGRVGRVSLNAMGGTLVLRRVDPNRGRNSDSSDRRTDAGAVVGEFAARAVRIRSLN